MTATPPCPLDACKVCTGCAHQVVTTPSPVEVRDALRTLNTVRDLPDDHPDRQAAVAAKQQVIRRIEEGQHG